ALGIVIAGAVTWFREGRPTLIPQGFMFGGTIAGITAAALGLGIGASPLMLATGAMVGLRNAIGMLIGAVIAHVFLAPWLIHNGVVPANDSGGALISWLVWPSLGMMAAGSFLPLLLEGGAILRSFRQLAVLARRASLKGQSNDGALSPRLWAP